MRFQIFFITIMVSLFFMLSCSKDNEGTLIPTPTNPQAAIEYLPATKGNYWIYELYAKPNNEADYSPTGTYDTLTSIGDTLVQTISGNTKYKGLQTTYGLDPFGSSKDAVVLFRDSTDALLYRYGDLMLSTSDSSYHEYFKSSQVIQSIQMKFNASTTVPSGTYTGIYAENIIKEIASQKLRYQGSRFFVKGIGIVKEVISSADDKLVEKRLVKYHLN